MTHDYKAAVEVFRKYDIALKRAEVAEKLAEALELLNNCFVKSSKDNMEFAFIVPYNIYDKMKEALAEWEKVK